MVYRFASHQVCSNIWQSKAEQIGSKLQAVLRDPLFSELVMDIEVKIEEYLINMLIAKAESLEKEVEQASKAVEDRRNSGFLLNGKSVRFVDVDQIIRQFLVEHDSR
jgi:DNA-binding LacI/PurR family transcriptional regulator